jgi:ribosomal protein S18 acetylase RimI-like enzyme
VISEKTALRMSNMPMLEFDTDRLVDQSRATFEQTASSRLRIRASMGPPASATARSPEFAEQPMQTNVCDSGYEANNDQWLADTDTVGLQHDTSEKVLRRASQGQAKQSALDLDLLTSADWRVLRAVRLQALLNSPHAFTSTYARESGLSEPEWRQLFDSAMWIVARDAEKVVGLARSVGELKRPTRHVESIWVAPTHRRHGVFRALLHAIAEMEQVKGVTDLLLWVLEDNYSAQRAYEALGFKPTGERQFLPAMRRFERRLQVGIRRLQESESTACGFGVHHNDTELDQRPRFQLQEIHSLMGAARTVDAV